MRSAGPSGGEQPRRSPGQPSPELFRAGPAGICLRGVISGCWLPAGWGKGAKAEGFLAQPHGSQAMESAASSPLHMQLSASQTALGLLSESGFVWRLPAEKAAGSLRSDGYSAAARSEKPTELSQHEGEHSGTQVNAAGKAPLGWLLQRKKSSMRGE